MISRPQSEYIARKCLEVLQKGPPWHRNGRPTKKGEKQILRIMSDVSGDVIAGGLSALCYSQEERSSVYGMVVASMCEILSRGECPRVHKVRTVRNVPIPCKPAHRQYRDPIFERLWRNSDGDEFLPHVPNPDSDEPEFGTYGL